MEYILMELNGMSYKVHPKIAPFVLRAEYIRTHFPKLSGKPINMSEAARKYGLTNPSISNMARRGQIKTLGRDPQDPRAVLVDEGEIAYCAAVRRVVGVSPGRKIFNKDGSLYIPPEFRIH